MADPSENLSREASAFGRVAAALLRRFAAGRELAKRHRLPLLFGENGDGNPERCWGDFLCRVARNDRAGLEKIYGCTKAAMTEDSGTTGGYLVPPELQLELMADVAEVALFRPRAFVQPMGAATLMLPLPNAEAASGTAGVSPFFGGAQMAWIGNDANFPETELSYRQLELRANLLAGYATVSNTMLADGGLGLEVYLRRLFAASIAWFEDYAFLQGTGVGQPLGVMNGPAAIQVTRNTGGAIKEVDMASMFGALLPISARRSVWLASPTAIAQIVQMTGFRVNGRLELIGLPVWPTEKLPALGTTGDLILTDPGLYVIGDRQQVEIAASAQVGFLNNQQTWRVVERVDGQPWFGKPITLQDQSTKVSPTVILH